MIEVFNLKEKPSYITEVIKLIYTNKETFTDDYFKLDEIPIITKYVKENEHRFFIALNDKELIMVFAVFNIMGGDTADHSCELMGVAKRKVSPIDTRKAFFLFTDKLFEKFKFVKLKAHTEVYVTKNGRRRKNPSIKLLLDLGFKKEGYIKGHSLKNGLLKNVLQYGKLNKRYIENDNWRRTKISKTSRRKSV